MRNRRSWTTPLGVGVGVLALAMVATGCGSSGGSSASSSAAAPSSEAASSAAAPSDSASGGGGAVNTDPIKIGVIPGWTDEVGTAFLAKDILEQGGYNVEIVEVADNAPMYTGLANCDIDVLTSSWSEGLHKSYMEEYGADLQDLGTWYEGASSFLAVPDYSKAQSIEDLPGLAADFKNTVTGIEPGAGLTKATQESVFPAYGLDADYELQLSSTAAMLTALDKAISNNEEIVVTMWKPFWANAVYPIRALADPKGAYGKPENLHILGCKDFATQYPGAAAMLSQFKIPDELWGAFEDGIVNKFEPGQEAEAAKAFIAENPEWAAALVSAMNGG